MKNILTKQFFIVSMIIALTSFHTAYGQTGVRIASTAGPADNSAMLDVVSTSKGVLIPRMNSGQRTGISTPAQGLLVFQTDAPIGFWFYNGTTWIPLSQGASVGGTGTDKFIARWTTGNQLTNSVMYDDGTNVGIGTTTPVRKLEVNNAMKFTNSSTDANDGVIGTAPFSVGLNIVGINTDAGGRKISYWGSLLQQENPVGNSFIGANKFIALAGTGNRQVWADANGTLNTSGKVVATKTAESGAIGAVNTSLLVTPTMSVEIGEVIQLTSSMELHWTGGSGDDRWYTQTQVNGCAGGVILGTTITARPNADHAGYFTFYMTDIWVATCTGNVTFQCNANRYNADDNWTHRNVRILAVKY